jgi:hypothetical protein
MQAGHAADAPFQAPAAQPTDCLSTDCHALVPAQSRRRDARLRFWPDRRVQI